MGFYSNPYKSFWKFVSNTMPGCVIPNDPNAISLNCLPLFILPTTAVSIFSSTSSCLSYNFYSNCWFLVNGVEHGLSKLLGISAIGPDKLSGDFIFNFESFLSYPFVTAFYRR